MASKKTSAGPSSSAPASKAPARKAPTKKAPTKKAPAAGATARQGWTLRVSYPTGWSVEEHEIRLAAAVRQGPSAADGDRDESYIEFTFTTEADARKAAGRAEKLRIEDARVDVFPPG